MMINTGLFIEKSGHFLTQVTERTKIEKGTPPRYTEDDGQTWTDLAEDTIVSMNMWASRTSHKVSSAFFIP